MSDMTITLGQVKLVPVASLHAAPWNPRLIQDERFRNLCRSIQRDPGLMGLRPILATTSGEVIAGNMRLRAVTELGWTEVPAIVTDMSDALARQRAITDNGSWGAWVDQDLAEILHGLEAQGADIGLLGMSQDRLEELMALVGTADVARDEDFDPTPPSEPVSQPGDIWVMGPHRLAVGSAADTATWLSLVRSLPDPSTLLEAMWTDPPYGVDLQVKPGETERAQGPGRTVGAIAGDRPDEAEALLRAVWPLADKVLKPGAPIYVAGPSGVLGAMFVRVWQEQPWHLAQQLTWVKSSFVPGRSDYHHQTEAIYYGWKQGAGHPWNGALDKGSVIDDEPDLGHMKREELMALVKAMRNERGTDAVRIDKTRHNDLHPTMKPPALIRHMLGNSMKRGETVVDPFAGSGSTMVAAHTAGRRAALIELEPKFADVIVRRWEELTPGNTAELVRQ